MLRIGMCKCVHALQTLFEVEQEQFEQEAIDNAEPFNQRFYAERKTEGGSLFRTVRRSILTGHFASRLSVV
jgi:hypothetical protein